MQGDCFIIDGVGIKIGFPEYKMRWEKVTVITARLLTETLS